jgi:hypothetical protein
MSSAPGCYVMLVLLVVGACYLLSRPLSVGMRGSYFNFCRLLRILFSKFIVPFIDYFSRFA